jgi:fused signal recognition particle receptor
VSTILNDLVLFLLSTEGKIFGTFVSILVITISVILSYFKEKNQKLVESSTSSSEIKFQDKEQKILSIQNIDNRPNDTALVSGLQNSRNAFWNKFKTFLTINNSNDDQSFVILEELLIESDLGVRTSTKLVQEIKEITKKQNLSLNELRSILKTKITESLYDSIEPEIIPTKVDGMPKVVVVVGVNGAGKTTTIGKLAFQFRAQGAKVMVAACDTFRAAASGQLEVWCDRAGAIIEKGTESEKPSTVAYRAVKRAIEESMDVLLIDTAGRLHTKVNLMNELSSVTNIISRELPGAPHETLLVLDGATGQNALQQAREFNLSTKLSGIVITKLDGTQKGGIVVAVKDELKIPVRYLGVGEGVGDLRPFDSVEFVEALFGDFDLTSDELIMDLSSSSSVSLKTSINASSSE